GRDHGHALSRDQAGPSELRALLGPDSWRSGNGRAVAPGTGEGPERPRAWPCLLNLLVQRFGSPPPGERGAGRKLPAGDAAASPRRRVTFGRDDSASPVGSGSPSPRRGVQTADASGAGA